MEPQDVHKTYRYKLKPTPEEERLLERTLMLCRHVYNAAINERREAWLMRGVSVTKYQQIINRNRNYRASRRFCRRMPMCTVRSCTMWCCVSSTHFRRSSGVLPAFFRRIREGQIPGHPRFHGRGRYDSFTYP
jgi:putative transposase